MRVQPSREVFVGLETRYLEKDKDEVMVSMAPLVMKRGHLTGADLESLCRWKSPRALPLIRRNSEEEVRAVTSWALSVASERLRIESPQLLHGVSWASASVILHWFHDDPYPILDVRALWSMGIEAPSEYTFELWWGYVERFRRLAATLGLSKRAVDRALWQYSKENGGPGSAS